MRADKDLYELLGLPRGASREDVRKTHRRLAREYHPDANPGDRSAEERFKEVQHAYEILSNEEKRREYDERLRASSSPEGNQGRPRARGAGERTGRRTTSRVDLSEALRRLANLSSDSPGGRREGDSRLQGEDIARVARQLGVDVSRLSRLLGENIRVNAKVSFGDTRSSEHPATGEDAPGGKPSGAGDKPQEKRVKGPNAQRKEKRVRGPNAWREGKSD